MKTYKRLARFKAKTEIGQAPNLTEIRYERWLRGLTRTQRIFLNEESRGPEGAYYGPDSPVPDLGE